MITTLRASNKTRVSNSVKATASGTGFGRIHRIDRDNINPKPLCFVSDERLQLEETPITQPSVEPLSFSLFPDTFQVFHYNSISTIESGNNLFADFMVFNSHETSLFSRDFFEQSLGTASAFGLKSLSQSKIFAFDFFGYGRMEKLPVRSDKQFIYAEVQAKNTSLRLSAIDLNLFSKSKEEETSAFFINSQQAFSHVPSEIFFEAIRNDDIKGLPSFDCSNPENVVFKTSTSWKVISDRTFVDDRLSLGFFNISSSLFNAGDSELAMQTDVSEMLVNERMKFNIVSDFFIPSNIDTELQTFFIEGNSLDEFGSCLDFDFCCCTKSHNGYKQDVIYKINEVKSQFIPSLKTLGILETRL